ncbi:unnamed protein product [Phytophthora fragariaefolia]|uniref:Unnamed protein product n=1 Tax=Phytophthora fragariaefolia TaxID=1490495 RepID=A0A9W7D1G8_9STRA|nr:unnamed protein product [Phytophthora fragariaefolia]
MGAKHTVTPRAKAKFDKQISASARTVRKNSESVFHVEDVVASVEYEDALLNNGSRTFTVDLQTGACTRCPDRHQMQIPCRHNMAALHVQSGSSRTTTGAYRYFHHAYTAPSYAQAFERVAINLSSVPALMPDPNILPPSLSKQGGGSSSTARRDIAKREKRIHSTGEPNTSRPLRHPKKKATISSERARVLASMHDLFSSDIRAEQPKKRQNYTCSLYGRAERYNGAKCPNRAKGTVDDDVRAGIYIVGSCPLELLEHRNLVSTTEPKIQARRS